MCNTVLFLSDSGFGPNSPKLPMIPPIISTKMKSPIMVMMKMARRLGQKIFPKVILFSGMEQNFLSKIEFSNDIISYRIAVKMNP
jgi:hypothetical protein